jgi:hypothetical protein
MALGRDLLQHQVLEALDYNRRHHPPGFVATLRASLGLANPGTIDETFVRTVADWQEANLGALQGSGKVEPRTEAHLNIVHARAIVAVTQAQALQVQGSILFDSWGNDLRDNNIDGVVDGPGEVSEDGAHYGGLYSEFRVVAGTYAGGWREMPGSVVVRNSRAVRGSFRYRVCADIVSQAYHQAGIMPHLRRTHEILDQFRHKGYLWRRSDSYPTKYLPGDFISTWKAGDGGHSGIVMREAPTRGGSEIPIVVQLPGPSTQVSDGTYDPASTNDVTFGPWSRWRIEGVPRQHQYLGRILHSRIR